MREKENIGGALEGKVHIPRNFSQRDGALLLSAVMLLFVLVNVLLIISVMSSRTTEADGYSSDYHRYEKDRMFITGFTGLALFFITTPVLFAGALNLFKGRKKIPLKFKAGMITGFVLFLVLFFVMLVTVPVYFADSLEDRTVSSTHQLFTMILDGVLLTSLFLMLYPHTAGKNRRTVLSGFIIMVIPLGLFTLLALMTGNDKSFFLSSIPRYILSSVLYAVAGIGFFISFLSLRDLEAEIEPGGFIPGRPYQLDEVDEGGYEEGTGEGASLIREYEDHSPHPSSREDERVKFIVRDPEGGRDEPKNGMGFFSMFTMKEDVPSREDVPYREDVPHREDVPRRGDTQRRGHPEPRRKRPRRRSVRREREW